MNGSEKRLIEDFLPIEKLNALAGKEMLHPKHPMALIHYWPARRPNTASRAAIYAALVPAPQSEVEREAAARFVEKLAVFNVDRSVLAEARDAILSAHGGNPPRVLDMFSGRGTIPLEAARLGCDSVALDYSPVAHLIELCATVYPQQFGPALAADVDRWGKWLLKRLQAEVGDLYPAVRVPVARNVAHQSELFGDGATGGSKEPVGYIWVRAVICKKPGCGCPVPLVRQAWLRKKGGMIAAIPRLTSLTIDWNIVAGANAREVGAESEEQTGAGESACLKCSTPVTSEYVKECSISGGLREMLAAVIVEGSRSKLYLPPSVTTTPDETACLRRMAKALADGGIAALDERMNTADSTTVAGRGYGIEFWHQLFTTRQLLVLVTLVKTVRQAHAEMLSEGMQPDRAKAVVTYLAMAFGRLANSFNKFVRWKPRDQITIPSIGDRQAMKMVYDFPEINPFAETAGSLPFAIENEAYCIRYLSGVGRPCTVVRGNAEKLPWEDESFDAILTDPPYYSSIFYADLSAFFYVWLRRLVGDLYPEHFALPAPPKRREAVAQPSEHGGDAVKAKDHYRQLMENSFAEARRVLKPGAPLVCVYAHKTTAGWASLIRALMGAGLTVTEAWPIQTESSARLNTLQAAALSDSIFFVARRREGRANGQYETDVRPELEHIARERVATLWADGKGIGGAELLMAAVGAGLRPYTQFGRVEYSNGEEVSAERYLQEVEGVVLDTMLEQVFGFTRAGVSGVDKLTRFYVLWRFTYRESAIEAGDAIVFCYPQGIELDGPNGIAGSAPRLVEKVKSSYRVRTFKERGDDEDLGVGQDGVVAPLIDVLHRVLWIVENKPAKLGEYLKAAQPNLEQLRLVAQSLCGPVLKRADSADASLTPELSTLSKLTANWRSVMDGASYTQEMKDRRTGQQPLSLKEGE